MSKVDEPTRDVFESGRRGLRHQGVRRANERTVLTVIGFNSGASNAEISRLSGLAPQTVSAILVDLEKDGLIHRGPVLRGRRGQPATPILLHPDGGLAIGVEIGWRHLDVVLLNMHAQILGHRHIDYGLPDAATIVQTIGGIVDELVAVLTPPQRQRLLDLGVAMPGQLAPNLHLLGASPAQVEAWHGLDLVDALHKRTGLAITLFNDGNAGCWAELIALARPRPANIIYLLVSHFVAAGIVGDGALWEGATGDAAELGSILVSRTDSPPDTAHRVASLSALRSRLAAAGQDLSLLPTARLEDAVAEPYKSAWIDADAQALAQVIFNATTVVEHHMVVVDTALSRTLSAELTGRVEAE